MQFMIIGVMSSLIMSGLHNKLQELAYSKKPVLLYFFLPPAPQKQLIE